MTVSRLACVAAIVHDDAHRLLVIRRARPPARGRWSLPGGRVRPGESDAAAVRREVAEETGLRVAVGLRVGTVEVPDPPGVVYDVRDYACTLTGGSLRAGDDAAEGRWVHRGDLLELATTDGLLDALGRWGMLPR